MSLNSVRQEWWEVLSPPADLSDRCGQLVSHQRSQGDLTTEELKGLVLSIAQAPDLWKPLVVTDPARRRYRLLYEDDRIDIWVLSWMPGQATGFHDHDRSRVALMSVQGTVLEKQMLLPSGAASVEMTPGTVRTGGAGYIHSVQHLEGLPAVSVHAYSPPLKLVGQFVVDEQGILERKIEHGRRELMDNSIRL
ncbi:cysteine dioxygenase family protein [bacterium]|nr:cysteine dioxygenase family protein [bacterium]